MNAWTENSKDKAHIVTSYRADGNKIYIWDPNYPVINTTDYELYNEPYNQFITINNDGSWFNEFYKSDNEKLKIEFNKLYLIDPLDDSILKPSLPVGFNISDTLIAFSGNSDILLTDSLGRQTGYKNGEMIKNIPGTDFIVNLSDSGTGSASNSSKKIYMPKKIDGLTISVSGKTDENYDLTIAGGDYYTKISGVKTSSGQVDTFNSTNTGVTLNFDDNKTGNYSFLTDNFVNTQTGTVYLSGITALPNLQKYTFDWNKVQTNSEDSIDYQIDTNNDGVYDIDSNFSALPKSENAKGSISGYVKSTPSNAGWKICLDLNNNGTCEENSEPFFVTNSTGYYKFDNLEKGVYNVIEIPKNNWSIITPINQKYKLELNNGQKFKNINFENKKINGK